MKSKYIYIPIIILLLIIVYFKFIKNDYELSDSTFKLEDTTGINKIIITTNNQKTEIVKNQNKWIINKSLNAQEHRIKNCFKYLQALEIIGPAPKNKQESIIKNIKDNIHKVEIFRDETVVKKLLIGEVAENGLGTNVLNPEFEKVYILNLPGITNNLKDFLPAAEIYWRNNMIFNYLPHKIKGINVIVSKNHDKSFEIIKDEDRIELYTNSKKIKQENINIENLEFYLSNFQNIKYSKVEDSRIADTISNLHPEYEIIVESVDNNKIKLSTFFKYNLDVKKDINNVDNFDLNYCYGKLNDAENELLIIKYIDIDPILKDVNYFLK